MDSQNDPSANLTPNEILKAAEERKKKVAAEALAKEVAEKAQEAEQTKARKIRAKSVSNQLNAVGNVFYTEAKKLDNYDVCMNTKPEGDNIVGVFLYVSPNPPGVIRTFGEGEPISDFRLVAISDQEARTIYFSANQVKAGGQEKLGEFPADQFSSDTAFDIFRKFSIWMSGLI